MYNETRRAQRDLADVIAIIAEDNPAAAEHFLDLVLERYAALAKNPEMGRERPELAHTIRSFPLGEHYLIFYRPIADGILVLRFLHSARDIEKLL